MIMENFSPALVVLSAVIVTITQGQCKFETAAIIIIIAKHASIEYITIHMHNAFCIAKPAFQ
jgi:hypothetical protein